MADASRFPHLALPFAIVGGAGGWLSAGLVLHPVLYTSTSDTRLITALAGAALGAMIGLLLRQWCTGRRYLWQLDAPDPEERPPSDSWVRHMLAILLAGAAAGAVFALLEPELCSPLLGALGGVSCAAIFLPVCVAVLSAARRAQRARLGSLVARSDRRAVWGILATTLVIASLEALPDWPAPRDAPLFGPGPALALLIASIACILGVLMADLFAWRRALWVLAPGLTRREASDPGADDGAFLRVDLGVGDDLHAHVSRTGAVYRGRDRTLALVQGDPTRAMQALRGAIRRGVLGLAVAAAVSAAHFAATTDGALARYEELRCERGNGESCGAAALVGPRDPQEAVLLYEHGCDRADGASCMSLARLYRGEDGIDADAGMVALFEYRAAQRGLCPDGTRLVRGAENVCVEPLDPRW